MAPRRMPPTRTSRNKDTMISESNNMNSAKDKRERPYGFTIVEIMVTLAVFAIFALAMGAMVTKGYSSERAIEDQATVTATANTLLGRINAVQFGTTSDAAPTTAQINEFFDSNSDLGNITFQQLRIAQGTSGYIGFTISGLSGTVKLTISNDLDDNGNTTGFREGRTDLYRVEVKYNNNLILRTYRAAPIQR